MSDAKDWTAMRLALLGYDFTVQKPTELVDQVRESGERLSKAAGGTGR